MTTAKTATNNNMRHLSSNASAAEVAAKPSIHAQRFRTKLCDKFATTGSCPYVHRCMFAHGEAELRTSGQNVADGLVNETSIRKYKRAQYEARKRAARSKPAAPASSHTTGGDTAVRTHHPMPTAVPASFSAAVAREGADYDIPSAASILGLNGVRDTDACSADESASVYGAGEDEGALSDSGNTSHRRPRGAPAASGSPFRVTSAAAAAGSRFRHDPYSVDCTLRIAPVRVAASGAQNPPLLPAALVSLDRSSSDF